MGLFGDVSRKFRETVDETIAQKRAEITARKKLSEIETNGKIETKAKTYTKKGLSVDEAMALARADIGKKKAAESYKNLGDSMKGLESSLGSSMGDLGSAFDGPKPVKQNKGTSASSGKSITININDPSPTKKRAKGKNKGNEPDYMSVFRN